MMNIMIYRIIAKQELEWIPREIPPTMIINCLHRRKDEKEHGFPQRDIRYFHRNRRTNRIQEKPLEGMII